MVGKKLLSASAALAMLASAGLSVTAEDKAVFTVTEARADSAALKAQQSAVLTFTDAGITETEAGSGYTVDGTVLTVTAAHRRPPFIPAPHLRQLHGGKHHRGQGADGSYADTGRTFTGLLRDGTYCHQKASGGEHPP